MCLCHQLLVSDVTQSNHTPPTALNKYFWTYQNFAKISPMFIYFSAFAVTKKNWGTSIGQHLTFCNYFFDFRTNQLFVDLKAKCIHYLQQSTVKNILISWWGGGGLVLVEEVILVPKYLVRIWISLLEMWLQLGLKTGDIVSECF